MSIRGGFGDVVAERLGRGRRATLGALVLALAATGVASATIPTDGVISACYSRSGGSLRVIDATVTKCGKSETSLAWNVQGPAGPQGEAGPAGPTGPAGANGVSAGFAGSLEEALEIDTATQAGIVVISKTAAAGSYILTARLHVASNGFTSAHCWVPGDRTYVSFGDVGVGGEEQITLTAGVTHAGGAIEVRCTKGASLQSDFRVYDASFTGVQVNTLN